MLGKLLIGFLILLALPVILLLVFTGLALFVPSSACPAQDITQVGTLDKVAKDLDRTGTATLTDVQATAAVRGNFKEIEDFTVCFKENEVGVSGQVKLGSFSPSFYMQTSFESGETLKASNSKLSIGGLGKIPGMTMLFGSIAEGMINDNLSKMPQDESYDVQIRPGEMTIKGKTKR